MEKHSYFIAFVYREKIRRILRTRTTLGKDNCVIDCDRPIKTIQDISDIQDSLKNKYRYQTVVIENIVKL